MQINPYLSYDGNCEEAFKFYEKAIGAKIDVIMPYEGTPAAEYVPPSMAKNVLHAQLSIDGEVIMGSDCAPGTYEKMQGISVCIQAPNATDGEKWFSALAEGGETKMPFSATFWSKGFGMCIDKFGVPWMVNTAQDCPDQ